jgi:DNA-binding PadR family transcriptional regulator
VAASEQRTLHALRVKGAAAAAEIARASGVEQPGEELDRLCAAGLLSRAGEGEMAIYALTDAGRARHAELLAEEAPAAVRERLGAAYESEFLPVNVELKRLCAEWQTEGESFERLELLVDVHERIELFLARASAEVARFELYSARLGAAADRVQDGDGDALVHPLGDSYHNVWFELHEDLIVTLGRSRADEED